LFLNRSHNACILYIYIVKRLIKCLIIDDDESSRLILEHYVKKHSQLELVASLQNGTEGLNFIISDTSIDLLFLDIEMPDLSGLQLLRALPKAPLTILTTSRTDYALDAYDLNVLDYLVKPVDYARFTRSVAKAMERLQVHNPAGGEPQDHVFVKSAGKIIRLELKEICYIEALSDYVIIATETQKHIVYSTLKGIEEKLPSEHFIRVHRSYIVNLCHVKIIEEGAILLLGKHIPVSKSYQEAFYAKIKML
jgi:DNA-binding LytR/AlgR family response regulator